ncbi:FxsA family protein [Pseudoruegeria sp. SK021]|uniref:FxsA family protein n=1 Tax=Pseudoruegeria sp. SK021 TaxID=1933035 RepID=UPI000A21E83F|nr:FxsA family protein [Pseudoruegeria sp. SK021]OSP55348.1 exlusion protein FxsA [Pseudoruegeria sp. SK021]
MRLLFIFILIPLIEIALFVTVGDLIGLWPTLLIVLATAVIGTSLVRSQGLSVMRDIQTSMDRLDNPAAPLAHGAMILLSGILLVTPGFFTDFVGFALLVPKVRDHVFNLIRSRITINGVQMNAASRGPGRGSAGRAAGDVIDGEFREIDPDSLPPRPGNHPSGWKQD